MIDKAINFESHEKPIIKTANQTLSALSRFVPFVTDLNKIFIFKFLLQASSVIVNYTMNV